MGVKGRREEIEKHGTGGGKVRGGSGCGVKGGGAAVCPEAGVMPWRGKSSRERSPGGPARWGRPHVLARAETKQKRSDNHAEHAEF